MLEAGVGTPDQYHLVRSGMDVEAFRTPIDRQATRASATLMRITSSSEQCPDRGSEGHDDLLHAMAP